MCLSRSTCLCGPYWQHLTNQHTNTHCPAGCCGKSAGVDLPLPVHWRQTSQHASSSSRPGQKVGYLPVGCQQDHPGTVAGSGAGWGWPTSLCTHLRDPGTRPGDTHPLHFAQCKRIELALSTRPAGWEKHVGGAARVDR